MKPLLFTGSGVAIVTPFTNEGINFEKLGELIDFQIANQTDAIIICGTTGEASTMDDEEHLAAIAYAVDKTAGRVPVIAGTGSNDTRHGIHLSQRAQELGADGLLLVTPYYNKTSQRGLVEHFRATASAVTIPVILYNVPGRTGMSMTVETCKELSKIENIAGIKEASGDIGLVAKIAASCGDDLPIYSGNDDMIVPILSLGGKGVISVAANILPRELHDICALYLEGKTGESTRLQLELLELINTLFIEVNPIPIKTAMNMMGFGVGPLRMPLYEMSEKNAQTLRQQLASRGLITQ